MRHRPLLTVLPLVLFAAACEAPAQDGPDAAPAADAAVDAAVDAADEGAVGAARLVAAPAAATIKDALGEAPALTTLDWLSGKPALALGAGEGSAIGRIVRHDEADSVILRRGHRASQDEQALLGTAVTLYDQDGARCHGTVTGLAEVAYLTPDPALGRRSSAALWRVAEKRGAVGVIALLATDCRQPLAADERVSDRVAAVPTMLEPTSPVAVDAEARLRALPRFAAAQAAYRAEPYAYDPDRPDWSESEITMVSELELAGRHYVTAGLERQGYCGDFGASVFAMWERLPGGELRLVVDSEQQPDGYDLAFDADHDGVPELVSLPEAVPTPEAVDDEGCGC